jgi:hypothetical protein
LLIRIPRFSSLVSRFSILVTRYSLLGNQHTDHRPRHQRGERAGDNRTQPVREQALGNSIRP